MREAYDETRCRWRACSASASRSGPVNPIDGRVQRAGGMPTWAGVDIREVFEPLLERPIFADNESNCSAIAEMTWGAAVGYDDFVALHARPRRRRRHRLRRPGDARHRRRRRRVRPYVIDPDGELCRCGNRGCLELYASFRKPLRLREPALRPADEHRRRRARASRGHAAAGVSSRTPPNRRARTRHHRHRRQPAADRHRRPPRLRRRLCSSR